MCVYASRRQSQRSQSDPGNISQVGSVSGEGVQCSRADAGEAGSLGAFGSAAGEGRPGGSWGRGCGGEWGRLHVGDGSQDCLHWAGNAVMGFFLDHPSHYGPRSPLPDWVAEAKMFDSKRMSTQCHMISRAFLPGLLNSGTCLP